MRLPSNYYHCFLGNGLDAVLIGPTGSMVADKISVDRCEWYKSDRYYPEDKLVMVAGRWPLDKSLEHVEGSGWYEAAPLGRTWYHVLQDGQPLELLASEQRFVPQEGTLYTSLDYGAVKGEAVTWLHATQSLLVERYTFDQPVTFRASMGPGVWIDDVWDTDPFVSVDMDAGPLMGRYDLGETQGLMLMRLDAPTIEAGADGLDRWVTVQAQTITKYFAITDNRQGSLDPIAIERRIGRGYDVLYAEHLDCWRRYFDVSRIEIPDAQFQYFYEAATYHLKAMQNPVSGGLPVNNLRRTWSSHVFWDSYFLHRALLESNHLHEALEGCRFFQRTLDHAQRHAREEFGCGGLKWDWEITHDGRKAYGTLLHMKFQIHNNGSYANQLWGYYAFTQDEAMLREFYPILEGLAQFYMNCIVEEGENGPEIGYQVGVHESPIKVRNDGTNLSGTIAILRHCANAARVLGQETDFTRRCTEVADGLMATMDSLYNGAYFQASAESDMLNMSSMAPIYPMGVIPARDPRALDTSRAYLAKYPDHKIGHGTGQNAFPWAAGVLGAILARQGDGDTAWQVVQGARPTICTFGGMTEVMENGEWNMQYFGTAEAAVMTALHQMLLQALPDGLIRLFPAIPSEWDHAAFENLLVEGMRVSARLENGVVTCALTNQTGVALTRVVRCGEDERQVILAPGETTELEWTL